jgi:hypothetical protein
VSLQDKIQPSFFALTRANLFDTLVISPANEDRFDVNEHIRKGLKNDNTLGNKSIQSTNFCVIAR